MSELFEKSDSQSSWIKTSSDCPGLRTLLNEDRRILFLGVGNVLRSDDGVGVYICNNIQTSEYINTICVEVSIENYISKIQKTDADILVILDCMDFKKESGYWSLVDIQEIDEYIINTHNISLHNLSHFFDTSVYLLGIQPLNLNFGENLSPSVAGSADEIIKIINKR